MSIWQAAQPCMARADLFIALSQIRARNRANSCLVVEQVHCSRSLVVPSLPGTRSALRWHSDMLDAEGVDILDSQIPSPSSI